MEIGEGEPKEKDIVWAKIKGYPWWPGIIRNISNHLQTNPKGISKRKIYTVDFIGNKSHGEVTKKDIQSFRYYYEEHCKTKNPSLMKSIELAKKLENKIVNNKPIDSMDKDTDKMNLLNKKRKESNKDEENNSNNTINNNNIKINININVTNNNQRTVNINSFSNIKNSNENNDKKKQIKMRKNDKNKLKDDEEYIYEDNEESDDDENEEIEEEYNYDEESLENELMDIKMNNYKYINNRNKDKDRLRLKSKKRKLVRGLFLNSGKNIKNEIFSENDSEIYDEKNEEINKIIQKLVNYQIQIFNTQNQKLIIKELDNLQIAMKNNENINDNYNELYKVLSTFTYNKNSEIVLKSTDLLTNLTYKIINDLFSLSEEEKNLILKSKQNIMKDDEYEYLEIKKLVDLVTNKNNNLDEMSINSKKNKYKKSSNEDNNDNANENNDKMKSINDNLSDNIINIIINNLNENFIQISDDFFKNIYNKNDNGLDKNLAIKRKSACIKLLSLCRKTFPKLDEEYLKKIILFFEYKIRSEDPTLGKRYIKEIDDFYYKLKSIYKENNNEKEQ